MTQEQLQALHIVLKLANDRADEYNHCQDSEDWWKAIRTIEELESELIYKDAKT